MTIRKFSRALERLLSIFLPVGAGFGLLYLFYEYVSEYASKRTWAIVFLSLFCIFLFLLIGIIKGFYERTVNRYEIRITDIMNKYESDMREWQTTLEFSKHLTGPQWMGYQILYFLRDNMEIPKRFLERWSATSCKSVEHVTPNDISKIQEFHKRAHYSEEMWDSIPAQINWIEQQTFLLSKFGKDLVEEQKKHCGIPQYDEIGQQKWS